MIEGVDSWHCVPFQHRNDADVQAMYSRNI